MIVTPDIMMSEVFVFFIIAIFFSLLGSSARSFASCIDNNIINDINDNIDSNFLLGSSVESFTFCV